MFMVKEVSNIFEVEQTGDNFSCNCEFLERTALPCRHILRVLIILKKSIMRADHWKLKDVPEPKKSNAGREKCSRRNRLK